MNPLMKFLQKRPKDSTIRAIKIIFWLVYIGVLSYNFFLNEPLNQIQDNLFWMPISDTVREAMKYVIVAFWFIPLATWWFNLCITKWKYVRMMQIVYAVLLFYFSHIILPWPDLDIDALVLFMAFIPLFGGITWKFITSSCLNYWYKQTKIRV